MVFNSIQTVLMVFILLAIGYALTAKGVIVPEKHSAMLSKLITYIAAPSVLFNQMLVNFTRDMIMSSGRYFLAALAAILFSYAIAYALIRILKVPKGRRGAFAAMCAHSNTIFVGLPVCIGIFGERSVPFVLYYYAVNTVLFWTMGNMLICKDGGRQINLLSLTTLKSVLSPPLMAFLLSLACILLQIPMPQLVLDTAKTLGGMTTPLSILFVGMVVHQAGFKRLMPDVPLSALAIVRTVVAPVTTYFVAHLLGIGTLANEVFTVQAAMPVMTFSVVYSGMVGADTEFAMRGVMLTTFLSLIVIPGFMALMPAI